VLVRICNGCSRRFQLSELKRGRCPSCLRQYYRERGTTRARGYTGAWKRLSAAVLNRDNYVCRYCGGRATTADHVVPKSKGGSDAMSNLVAACRSCNSGKRDRSPRVSSGVNDFRSFQRKLRDPVFLREHGGDPALVSRERNSENLMVKRKNSASAEIVSEVRNTLESPRGVVAVRLSDSERERIARAAEARNLAFSSFVRWASLQAASDQLLRQKSTPEPDPGEHEPVVIGDTEQRVHYVDGEPVLR
jgi:5-methylcytosine-specific restriction endonuclease McrA